MAFLGFGKKKEIPPMEEPPSQGAPIPPMQEPPVNSDASFHSSQLKTDIPRAGVDDEVYPQGLRPVTNTTLRPIYANGEGTEPEGSYAPPQEQTASLPEGEASYEPPKTQDFDERLQQLETMTEDYTKIEPPPLPTAEENSLSQEPLPSSDDMKPLPPLEPLPSRDDEIPSSLPHPGEVPSPTPSLSTTSVDDSDNSVSSHSEDSSLPQDASSSDVLDDEVPVPPPIFSKEGLSEEEVLEAISRNRDKYEPDVHFEAESDYDSERITEYHEGQPLFVNVDQYKGLLAEVEGIKAKIKNNQDVLNRLNEIKNSKDREFEKWRTHLENLQRKLLYVDKIIFD